MRMMKNNKGLGFSAVAWVVIGLLVVGGVIAFTPIRNVLASLGNPVLCANDKYDKNCFCYDDERKQEDIKRVPGIASSWSCVSVDEPEEVLFEDYLWALRTTSTGYMCEKIYMSEETLLWKFENAPEWNFANNEQCLAQMEVLQPITCGKLFYLNGNPDLERIMSVEQGYRICCNANRNSYMCMDDNTWAWASDSSCRYMDGSLEVQPEGCPPDWNGQEIQEMSNSELNALWSSFQ